MRRFGHLLLYCAATLALAAVFVPSAAALPAAGDWLDWCMWWHGERS